MGLEWSGGLQQFWMVWFDDPLLLHFNFNLTFTFSRASRGNFAHPNLIKYSSCVVSSSLRSARVPSPISSISQEAGERRKQIKNAYTHKYFAYPLDSELLDKKKLGLEQLHITLFTFLFHTRNTSCYTCSVPSFASFLFFISSQIMCECEWLMAFGSMKLKFSSVRSSNPANKYLNSGHYHYPDDYEDRKGKS